MNRWANVERAFSEWIRADDFLTRDDRRLMAEILFMHLFDPTYPSQQELDESGLKDRYPNWARIMEEILEEHRLRKVCKNNEEFATSVARETLRWFLSMDIRFHAQNDFLRQRSHFRHTKNHLSEISFDNLLNRVSDLMQDYPDQHRKWRFYERAFRQEQQKPAKTADAEGSLIRERFLQEWAREYHIKREQKEAEFLEGKWQQYLEDLSDKAERLEHIEELLEPFSRFLGEAWNMSLGNWKEIDWDQIKALGQQLKSDPQLRELLNWLGRWNSNKQARELRHQNDPLPQEHWQPNPFGKSEIIGIHYSDRLESVIPSEVAYLSSPDTEIIFSQKYVEHKLLTFQYRSGNIKRKEDPNQQSRYSSDRETEGPFILCVDTSGSMFGTPEQVAKGIALAVTEMALRSNRNCYLISFSTGTRAVELTGMEKEISRLVEFLKMSFHGSTDLQPALRRVQTLLKEERFRQADILVISDFLIPRLERELVLSIKQQKQQFGTRYHSMFVGRNPDASHVPLPVFDHHWIYDLNHPGVMRQWVSYMSILEKRRK